MSLIVTVDPKITLSSTPICLYSTTCDVPRTSSSSLILASFNPCSSLAREEQGLNEARIRELEDVLGTSQVVEYKQMGVEDRVIFGSTVTIKDIENDEIKKYQIVGDAEASASPTI